MSESVKSAGKSPFLINLDDEVVALPGKGLESMMAMFAHLEGLALRRTKNLGRVSNSSSRTTFPNTALPKCHAFDNSHTERVSFRELGRQVIGAAQGHVRILQTRAQEMQSLVLINNWRVAEELWSEFLPECKTPLFELNFLEELWGVNPDQWEIGGWSLTRHWQQFVLIQAEVEVLLARRQSLLELSDTLEGHLGLWLKRFGEILEKLDETSAA